MYKHFSEGVLDLVWLSKCSKAFSYCAKHNGMLMLGGVRHSHRELDNLKWHFCVCVFLSINFLSQINYF